MRMIPDDEHRIKFMEYKQDINPEEDNSPIKIVRKDSLAQKKSRRLTILSGQIEKADLAEASLISETSKSVKLEDFKCYFLIGKGGFGKVILGEYNNELYAIKKIRKDLLVKMNFVKESSLEKTILQQLNHPFLINADYVFQTEERLYYVMPFCKYGDLLRIAMEHTLSETVVRFYIY